MKLIFLYGTAAAGKLTVAKRLAERTGFALFHNHLVVDAVGAVFPFGSEPFVRLRERFWLETFAEAAKAGRSLIFTFAPESSVAADFPERVRSVAQAGGGEVLFVRLAVSDEEQERRIANPSRTRYGKLVSLELLRELRASFKAANAAMPAPILTIDTGAVEADDAAQAIAEIVLKRSQS